ncbi:MAG: hypothetical protein H0W06_11860 [Chloroflexia bacterium]|nr:hypothetical protein [Chloroflexia bacterium]
MSANAQERGRGFGAILLSVLLALMAMVPLAATAGAQATPAAEATPVAADLGLEFPEIEIRAQETNYSITVPAPVAAGPHLVRFVNQTDVVADANLVLLPEDRTSGDLSGALVTAFTGESGAEFPDWFDEATFVGGSWADAQGTNEVVLNLTPGRYYVFTSNPSRAQSVQAFTVVTPEEAAGEPAPATPTASPSASPVAEALPSDVQVSATEFEFSGAELASTGTQLWQVTNDGENIHNAVLVGGDDVDEEAGTAAAESLASGESAEDGEIVGAVGILSPAQTAYMLLDLEAGGHALVDTLPDPDSGDLNIGEGMVAVVEVE